MNLFMIYHICIIILYILFTETAKHVGSNNYDFILNYYIGTNVGILVYSIILFYKLYKTILTPPVLYFYLLYIFTSGQVLLKAFNLDLGKFNIFERLTQHYVIESISYTNLALLFFILAFTFNFNRSNFSQVIKKIDDSRKDTEVINIVNLSSKILMIIGAGPFFLNLFYNLIFINVNGYGAFYEDGARLNIPFLFLSHYFIVGIILYITTAKKTLFPFILIIFITIIELLSGDRGDAFTLLLTVMLLYIYFIKKNKIKISALAALFVLVNFLTVMISTFRKDGVLNSLTVGNIINVIENENIFTALLANTGGTIWPLAKIIEIEENYSITTNGLTYLGSIIYFIPNFLRIGFLNEISNNYLYTRPANWLMEFLNMSYGPGFSPFAESYLNFNQFGFLSIFIFGLVILFLLSPNFLFKYNFAVSVSFSIITFYFIGMSARGTFNVMLAFYVRYVILPIILIIILYRINLKLNNKNKVL